MPTCKLCHTAFPNRTRIYGRKVDLHTRKYCLVCSPFNCKNTKTLDKPYCVHPNKTPGKRLDYKYRSNEYKEKIRKRNSTRRKRLKLELVNSCGGECRRCGYKKYPKLLHFHHRDPEIKNTSLSSNAVARMPWSEVMQEVTKCDLLCSNCHLEEHEVKIDDVMDKNRCLFIRRHKRKQRLIDLFGGCCNLCGFKKSQRALQFHHLDPTDKKFELNITYIANYTWSRVLEEAKKCQLLCSNCHAELHEMEREYNE